VVFGEAKLILDTNALSATADEDLAVVAILATAQRMALPVVAIGEYRYGIAQSRHAARYRRWLEEFIKDCEVLDIGEQTAQSYSSIRVELKQAGTPIPTNDLWIAALCRQHSLPIVSQDRHFDAVPGLERIGW
jgi:tRNA(fMet)-specific endonuclease VapC